MPQVLHSGSFFDIPWMNGAKLYLKAEVEILEQNQLQLSNEFSAVMKMHLVKDKIFSHNNSFRSSCIGLGLFFYRTYLLYSGGGGATGNKDEWNFHLLGQIWRSQK